MLQWLVVVLAMLSPPVDQSLPAKVHQTAATPSPIRLVQGSVSRNVALAERILHAQGYLRVAPNRDYNFETTQAVLAFQGHHRLRRDGAIGPNTWAKLQRSSAPRPYKTVQGSRRQIQASLSKQTVQLIENGRVVYTLHTSPGKPGYSTPTGSWTIERRVIDDWSYSYDAPMPYAQYFYRGYAIHESNSIPGYAASHGCLRLSHVNAKFLWDWAAFGTPVTIMA